MGEESIILPPASKKARMTLAQASRPAGSLPTLKVIQLPRPMTGMASPLDGIGLVRTVVSCAGANRGNSIAVAPVAGQNFGARLPERVRATFKDASLMAAAVMMLFAVLSNIAPAALVGIFTSDPAVVAVGVEYLRIVSWNYVASGLIFVASSMFQAMGNTVPSLIASAVRILLVSVPAIALSRLPGFQLRTIWYLSVAAVLVQLALAMYLLSREFRGRLSFAVQTVRAA